MLKEMISRFWTTLGRNKDAIDGLSKILQTSVVLVGAYLAYVEFIAKDAQAEREKIERTLSYGERLHGKEFFGHERNLEELYRNWSSIDSKDFQQKLDQFLPSYVEARRPIENYFSTLNALRASGVIDHSLICWLAGFHSYRYVGLLNTFLDDREVSISDDPVELGFNPLSTESFCSACAKAGYYTGPTPDEYRGTCRRNE